MDAYRSTTFSTLFSHLLCVVVSIIFLYNTFPIERKAFGMNQLFLGRARSWCAECFSVGGDCDGFYLVQLGIFTYFPIGFCFLLFASLQRRRLVCHSACCYPGFIADLVACPWV